MVSRSWWTLFVAFLLVMLGQGCQSNAPELAPVKGIVTYQGQPLTRGHVVFTPLENTRGPQAIGLIQNDGTFTMMTLDRPGAALGEHRVTIHSRAELTPEESKNLVIPKLLIPEIYGQEDNTPFRFEVKQGENQCILELK
jgi:hypothetical protein